MELAARRESDDEERDGLDERDADRLRRLDARQGLVGHQPPLPLVERPDGIDRHLVAVPEGAVGLAAVEDRPELEVQVRLVGSGGHRGDRLPLVYALADGDADLRDVVVARHEAEPAGVVVELRLPGVPPGLTSTSITRPP